MAKIAVLGAGINGLSCAVRIKEKYPNVDVVIISSEFTPNTTGDGSGGLWYPYICGDTPQHLLCRWGGQTYKYLHKLWVDGGHDISLLPMYELYREKRDVPKNLWSSLVFGYGNLGAKQLDYLSGLYSVRYVESKHIGDFLLPYHHEIWQEARSCRITYGAGRTFTTFITYPPSILANLFQRFKNANGKTLQSKIVSLKDTILEDYDVVVNCLGLGARQVVPDDKVVPIRGQISRVLAPWVTNAVVDEDSGNYILPNTQHCVLGGTHQTNDFNVNIDSEDTDYVLDRCKEIMPSLKRATLVAHWAGLRPGREKVRLEPEERGGKLYIHNYGHGGSGMTLFWGCATDVLQIFDTYMDRQKGKSKL